MTTSESSRAGSDRKMTMGGNAAFLLPRSGKAIVSAFWAFTPDERDDQKEEINELLGSFEVKIGDKRTDTEVANELGIGHYPMVDLLGDWDDAPGTEEADYDNDL